MMKWHILARCGKNDTYDPVLGPAEPRLYVGFEQPGSPVAMRESAIDTIRRAVGSVPSRMALDLLHAAMAVHTADLRVRRAWFEDRWTREFVLHLPVQDVISWQTAQGSIERMLSFLSGDIWHLDLRQIAHGTSTPSQPSVVQTTAATSLFSGGLDSLVGAIDLRRLNERVVLVGHYGAGSTKSFQSTVGVGLGATDAGSWCQWIPVYAQPPRQPGGGPGEPTQRTRSLLFMALGLAVADACGPAVPLYVPENGLISLNVPLTKPRLGSLSTRTTHPHYIGAFRDVAAKLGLGHEIRLPYHYKTKGEMLRECSNRELLVRLTPLTMSCAHPEVGRWEGQPPGRHCGYCVPCLVRQAATHAAGMADSTYRYDVRSDRASLTTRMARDLRAVEMALWRLRDMNERQKVAQVLLAGPVPPESLPDFGSVYCRGMAELEAFLSLGRQSVTGTDTANAPS